MIHLDPAQPHVQAAHRTRPGDLLRLSDDRDACVEDVEIGPGGLTELRLRLVLFGDDPVGIVSAG